MTTSVKVSAYCSDTKQVNIAVTENGSVIETKVLQDGESTDLAVYDNRTVTVLEVLKK